MSTQKDEYKVRVLSRGLRGCMEQRHDRDVWRAQFTEAITGAAIAEHDGDLQGDTYIIADGRTVSLSQPS